MRLGIKSRWLGVCLGCALAALWPVSAQAQYLDPGAGSVLVQAVIAVFVGVAAVVKLYWGRLSNFLPRRAKKDSGH